MAYDENGNWIYGTQQSNALTNRFKADSLPLKSVKGLSPTSTIDLTKNQALTSSFSASDPLAQTTTTIPGQIPIVANPVQLTNAVIPGTDGLGDLSASQSVAQGNKTISAFGNEGFNKGLLSGFSPMDTGEFSAYMEANPNALKGLSESEQAAISANLATPGAEGDWTSADTGNLIGVGQLGLGVWGAAETAQANKRNYELARDALKIKQDQYADTRADRAARIASMG